MDADLFADPPSTPQRAPLTVLRTAWTRWRPSRWLSTLKVRLALGMLAGLLLGMSVTAWQLTARAERDLLLQAQQRELRDAHEAAGDIEHAMAEIQEALSRVAGQVGPTIGSDPGRLGRALDREPILRDRFAEIVAFDADGRWLAHVGSSDAGWAMALPSQIGHAAFERALHERRVIVGPAAVVGSARTPAVVLAQPADLGDGRVIVIGGTLRLDGDGVLAAFDHRHVEAGEASGGHATVQVLTDGDGRVLSHPDQSRLMGSLADDPRLAQAYRAWTARGRPQATDPVHWTGSGDVVATAEVPLTGWRVWRALPESQILDSLRRARTMALRDAGLLAAGIAILLGGFLAWQLRPLAQLQRRAGALLTGEQGGDWPECEGEIGRLARTLRHVWAERAQAESFNAEVLRKLGSVMAAAPVGLAFTRAQRFELVSEELCRLLGGAEHELVGRPTRSIFVSDDDYEALGSRVAEAFDRRQPYSGEWPVLRSDGTHFWGLLRARPVSMDDPGSGTIWSITDVSDQVAARRALEHAAHHDALTGVVNRQGFERALQSVFDGQPSSRPASLVMIDLDHFKPINDTAGHAAGDAMLVAVAQAIASSVRSTDIVVRLGGDEFALLLPHCDHERALKVAEKVRESISDLALTWESHTLRVGASLGVAELSPHHESAAKWLAHADGACYEAKRAGRGTVRLAREGAGVQPVEA